MGEATELSMQSSSWTFEQRIDLLQRLRTARATILADAEAFVQATAVLEYVGQVGGKNTAHGLGHYRAEIVALAKETGRFEKAKDERDLHCLFDTVLAARNSAAHTGSYARHLSSRLVELILILEEAIIHGEPRMSQKTSAKQDDTSFKFTKVKHLMVGGPITAFDWNTLGQIRTLMLEHSFTYIPVKRADGLEPRWILISDAWLMATLRKATSRTAWNKALGMTVGAVLAECDQQKLHSMAANFCDDSDTIASIVDRLSDRPLLVRPSNRPEEIVGIITAYDLL